MRSFSADQIYSKCELRPKKYRHNGWFVGFAPYDNPEIAVVIFLPQGGHGGYAAPIARDIFAEYLGLKPQTEEAETDD